MISRDFGTGVKNDKSQFLKKIKAKNKIDFKNMPKPNINEDGTAKINEFTAQEVPIKADYEDYTPTDVPTETLKDMLVGSGQTEIRQVSRLVGKEKIPVTDSKARKILADTSGVRDLNATSQTFTKIQQKNEQSYVPYEEITLSDFVELGTYVIENKRSISYKNFEEIANTTQGIPSHEDIMEIAATHSEYKKSLIAEDKGFDFKDSLFIPYTNKLDQTGSINQYINQYNAEYTLPHHNKLPYTFENTQIESIAKEYTDADEQIYLPAIRNKEHEKFNYRSVTGSYRLNVLNHTSFKVKTLTQKLQSKLKVTEPDYDFIKQVAQFGNKQFYTEVIKATKIYGCSKGNNKRFLERYNNLQGAHLGMMKDTNVDLKNYMEDETGPLKYLSWGVNNYPEILKSIVALNNLDDNSDLSKVNTRIGIFGNPYTGEVSPIYQDMVNELGYKWKGSKITLPNDLLLLANGTYTDPTSRESVKAININPNSKGTPTANGTRSETAIAELATALKIKNKITECWEKSRSDDWLDTLRIFVETEEASLLNEMCKHVVVKAKHEILKKTKQTRLFCSTYAAAHVFLSYLINIYMSRLPKAHEEKTSNLSGLSNSQGKMAKVMQNMMKTQGKMSWHSSDNIYLKEDNLFVSADMVHCESAHEVASLAIPHYYLADMMLDGADKVFFKILTYFTYVLNASKVGWCKFIDGKLCSIPVWFLPSGMSGTFFCNHFLSGMGIYLKKKILDETGIPSLTKNGLTQEFKEILRLVGINLSLETIVDMEKIKVGDMIKFDLLGKDGVYIRNSLKDEKNLITSVGQIILPVLDEERIMKAMIFTKKPASNTDVVGVIFNIIMRQVRLTGLYEEGGFYYPNMNTTIFSVLIRNAIHGKALYGNLTKPETVKFATLLNERKHAEAAAWSAIRDPIPLDVSILWGRKMGGISMENLDKHLPHSIITGFDVGLDDIFRNNEEVKILFNIDGFVQRQKELMKEELVKLKNIDRVEKTKIDIELQKLDLNRFMSSRMSKDKDGNNLVVVPVNPEAIEINNLKATTKNICGNFARNRYYHILQDQGDVLIFPFLITRYLSKFLTYFKTAEINFMEMINDKKINKNNKSIRNFLNDKGYLDKFIELYGRIRTKGYAKNKSQDKFIAAVINTKCTVSQDMMTTGQVNVHIKAPLTGFHLSMNQDLIMIEIAELYCNIIVDINFSHCIEKIKYIVDDDVTTLPKGSEVLILSERARRVNKAWKVDKINRYINDKDLRIIFTKMLPEYNMKWAGNTTDIIRLYKEMPKMVFEEFSEIAKLGISHATQINQSENKSMELLNAIAFDSKEVFYHRHHKGKYLQFYNAAMMDQPSTSVQLMLSNWISDPSIPEDQRMKLNSIQMQTIIGSLLVAWYDSNPLVQILVTKTTQAVISKFTKYGIPNELLEWIGNNFPSITYNKSVTDSLQVEYLYALNNEILSLKESQRAQIRIDYLKAIEKQETTNEILEKQKRVKKVKNKGKWQDFNANQVIESKKNRKEMKKIDNELFTAVMDEPAVDEEKPEGESLEEEEVDTRKKASAGLGEMNIEMMIIADANRNPYMRLTNYEYSYFTQNLVDTVILAPDRISINYFIGTQLSSITIARHLNSPCLNNYFQQFTQDCPFSEDPIECNCPQSHEYKIFGELRKHTILPFFVMNQSRRAVGFKFYTCITKHHVFETELMTKIFHITPNGNIYKIPEVVMDDGILSIHPTKDIKDFICVGSKDCLDNRRFKNTLKIFEREYHPMIFYALTITKYRNQRQYFSRHDNERTQQARMLIEYWSNRMELGEPIDIEQLSLINRRLLEELEEESLYEIWRRDEKNIIEADTTKWTHKLTVEVFENILEIIGNYTPTNDKERLHDEKIQVEDLMRSKLG